MDYESIQIFFEELKNVYIDRWNEEAIKNIDGIIDNMKQLWEISKKHTIIKEK